METPGSFRQVQKVESLVPDENAQIAEAVQVVRHGLLRMNRGGRQGGKGRNPSMQYSGSRSRNPRECLRRAYEDLGFESLQEAKVWLEEQPVSWSRKLQLAIQPRPRNVVESNPDIIHPTVQIEYPTRVQTFLRHLNHGDLAEVRPLIFGVKDAQGETSQFMMRIMSDPRPDDRDAVLLAGRLAMNRGRAVHCLDGQIHAIFPGYMARLHIDPEQDLRHVEFLDIPTQQD